MATDLSRDELLTDEQAASLLNIERQTLAVWRSSGRHSLPFVRVGRCIRYRRSDLEKWLDQRVVTSTGQTGKEA